MTKFKSNFLTDFEQATKNDKKDYNTGVEKFFNKKFYQKYLKSASSRYLIKSTLSRILKLAN